MFTDGSKMNGYSGVGCLQTQQSISIPLGRRITAFQTENLGILRCSLELLSNIVNSLPMYICSDSQAALDVLRRHKFHLSLVLECRDTLQLFTSTTRSSGHNGITGNGTADRLAR